MILDSVTCSMLAAFISSTASESIIFQSLMLYLLGRKKKYDRSLIPDSLDFSCFLV